MSAMTPYPDPAPAPCFTRAGSTTAGIGVAAVVLAALAACSSGDPGIPAVASADGVGRVAGCIEDFEPGRDYFPEKAQLRHATGFSVTYHDHYKVLRIHPPSDQGGGGDVIVLSLCGTPAPNLMDDLEGASIVSIPVQTAAANEDLTLTRLRVLGLLERVVGVGGRGIYDPGLRGRWETGAAVEIGASFHGPPRFEVLLETRPGVTFLSTASLERAAPLRRARELGLAAAPSVSWVEPTLLAQAEWLQQVAVFFDAEAVANGRLGSIRARYDSLASAAVLAERRPTVLWIDPAQQGDRWIVPEAHWKAGAIADAGGRSIFADPDGRPTREVTSEEILTVADSIDFVLTESIALDDEGSAGVLESLPAIREGRLFSVHRRARPEHGAYDWYESAVVEVDRVLEDLVALLHPEVLADHEFHHLRPARASGLESGRRGR